MKTLEEYVMQKRMKEQWTREIKKCENTEEN
jgi:hypothetical protein